jgi:hypothetical protein
MKLIGLMSTAVLSMTLVAAAPAYAQEQHDQQEEQKSKPAQQEEKKTEPNEPAKQEEKHVPQQGKNARPAENNAQEQNAHQAKPMRQEQQAAGGRIPDDRFKANFGNDHRFRVSQADYRGHRFQYGGYSFGFVDPWPSNWLYTQDVYVIEINGVYYLCNPMYPGVNLALSFTL